jgi:hypothetical protein
MMASKMKVELNYSYNKAIVEIVAANVKNKMDNPSPYTNFHTWSDYIHFEKTNAFYDGFRTAQSMFRDLLGAPQSMPYFTVEFVIQPIPDECKPDAS